MKIGFTGTREGMSLAQRQAFVSTIKAIYPSPSQFHHGDCVGADKEAHDLIRALLAKCYIVIHPGNTPWLAAGCLADVRMHSTDNISRNHDIVDAVDLMLAAPHTDEEQRRSGTWATIRYAKRLHKKLVILKR